MSQSPKRSVGRRKAAEKSEQKWKEAMEEDKTFEALPEVFLGTYINSAYGRKGAPDTKFSSPSTAKNIKNGDLKALEMKNDISISSNSFSYTVFEDSTLKAMIKSFTCGRCLSKSLEVSLFKELSGKTDEIIVTCSRCKYINFKRNLSKSTYNMLSLNEVKTSGENILNQKSREDCNSGYNTSSIELPKEGCVSEDNSSSVELLVCDVDVIKEDPCKGEQEQEQICDVNVTKEDSCKGEQEQEGILQNMGCEFKRKMKHVNLKSKRSDITKPIRPCFFCSKMQARLSRHVKTTHANHPYVQNLLRQPKDIQAKMMRQLRSEGIFAENQRRIKAGRYDLLRIRNQGTGELSPCAYCKGYYKKKLLWRHKVTCTARFNKNTEEELLVNQDTENSETKNEIVDPKQNCINDKETIPNSIDLIEDAENGKLNDEVSAENPEPDPPEISKIKDILYGLEHGIFSQGVENVNGLLIKQEETDYTVLPDCQLGQKGELIPDNNIDGHEDGVVDEDQLLFDSIPSLLSNSNISYHTNNYSPTKKKKRRGSTPENNSYSDENHYYMWQDFSTSNLQCEDFLPCNTLYKPNKKRKPRSEFQYQFWKKEEEDKILNYFTDMIIAMKVPGKEACREFLNKNPAIQADWTRIKYKVYNQIQKRRKKLLKNS